MHQGMERRHMGSAHTLKISLLIAILALLATANPAQRALGAIRESDGPIVDRATKQTLNLLPTRHIGIPSPLPSGDAYLIVTQGAAYEDIRLLADDSVSPKRLASALESAVQGTPLAQSDVEYSQDDDYSAALIHNSEARIGLKSHATALSATELAANIRKVGISVLGILKVPRYASTSGLPSQHGHSSQFYWYNIDNLRAQSVRVQARITPFGEFQTVLFPFFVPVVTLLGFLSAIVVGRWQRLPIATRRRLYLKLVWYPCFAAIGLHIFYMLYYVQSTIGRLAGDLWFGSLDATFFIPFIALGPVVLMLVVPFATKMEKRLYGHEGEPAPKLQYTPEEKAASKTVSRWMFLPMALVFVPLIVRIFLGHRQTSLLIGLQFGGLAVVLSSIFVMRRIFRGQYAVLDQHTSDEALTARAESIAEQLGTKLGKIEVSEGPTSRQYASAMALSRGRVVVSRKLIETLNPDELDFILAHELAHVEGRHVAKQLALVFVGLLFLQVPLILTFGGRVVLPTILERDALFLTPLLGMAVVFAGFFYLKRKREYAADRRALEVTRNLPAAESALTKITQYSPFPYLHDTSDLPTHPKLSKRIAALRQTARELGIEASPIAEPASGVLEPSDSIP